MTPKGEKGDTGAADGTSVWLSGIIGGGVGGCIGAVAGVGITYFMYKIKQHNPNNYDYIPSAPLLPPPPPPQDYGIS